MQQVERPPTQVVLSMTPASASGGPDPRHHQLSFLEEISSRSQFVSLSGEVSPALTRQENEFN